MKFVKPTLGPINWSARSDEQKTTKMRNPKPRAEASNQFLSFDSSLAWNKLKILNPGFATHLSSHKTAASSNVSIASSVNACAE